MTDFEAAVRAVEGGATVIQLRLKGAPTADVIEAGRPFVDLPVTFAPLRVSPTIRPPVTIVAVPFMTTKSSEFAS